MSGRVVGIDLGTTYSAVAYINDLGKPEIIPNREGERITPSVVLFQGDSPMVGSMAKRSAATAPYDVVQFVKRSMGDASAKFMTSSGTTYTPEEVSAIILRRIVADAELALGEKITDVVVTVPAYFDDARRRSTMDSGSIAGLNVLRVLNEPTAAALSYGLDTQVGGNLLVYDLGGGTFDVTVMHVGEGLFDVLATGGDRNLGGFNWDSELMRWLDEQYVATGRESLLDDDYASTDLREKAEFAKRALTTVDTANVVLRVGADSVKVPVSRSTFEDLTKGLLNRTRGLTTIVLQDSGLEWDQIDRILLVGGSTRMPMVRRMVEELAGKEADRSINPDEVVAMGAAIQGHLTAGASGASVPDLWPGGTDVRVEDVTSQSLGVVALNERGIAANSIVIPANSKIPTKRSEIFSTVRDNQAVLEVEVTEGDDTDLDYVRRLGSKELPIPPYPQGARVEIFFAYDVDQTVYVEVKDLTSQSMLGTFEIDRIANMPPSEVEEKRRKMDGLDIE